MTKPIEALILADFQPYLNQIFFIRLDSEQRYELELVALEDQGEPPMAGLRKPFSLTFRNPEKKAYLPQRIYRLEHEQLGSLDLFIVPLGPDADGMRYEVIFN